MEAINLNPGLGWGLDSQSPCAFQHGSSPRAQSLWLILSGDTFWGLACLVWAHRLVPLFIVPNFLLLFSSDVVFGSSLVVNGVSLNIFKACEMALWVKPDLMAELGLWDPHSGRRDLYMHAPMTQK